MTLFRLRLRQHACLWFSLLPTTLLGAADPDDHWQLIGHETFSYDDNLFRLSSEPGGTSVLQPGMSKADYINQMGLNGKFAYALGRQRFLGDLRVDDNRFVRNEFLNNVSTIDKLSWKWQAGSNWSGNIGYTYSYLLAPFLYVRPIVKNMITDQNALFDVNYSWHPRWKAAGSFRWEDTTNGNPERKFNDRETGYGQLGINYTTPSANSLGLTYRFTSVFLPNRDKTPINLVDNHFQVQTGSLAFIWRPTVKTELDGRFGYSSLANRTYTQRDFSGPTWWIVLNWAATAKTQAQVETWRELMPSQIIDSSYMVVEGAGLSLSWNATTKLKLSSRVSYENLTFEGNPGVLPGNEAHRVDDLWVGRVGLSYLPGRNVELGLTYQGEKRNSNRRFNDFDDNTVTASVRLAF